METAPPDDPTRLAPAPGLTRHAVAGTPLGLVLLLHGGTQVSHSPVEARSASWRRSAAMQRSITASLHDRGVATWLLRYRVRGWNGSGSSVPDARWALDEVRRAHGDVPVVLLGHSMGARTAVHVADDPSVVGVVGLAPWWSIQDDPVHTLSGKHLRAAHGRSDHITSARLTREYVASADRVAASASFTDLGRVGHYMLRRIPAWNAFAVEESLDLLRPAAG